MSCDQLCFEASSSDIRAGKRSAPIVAALNAGVPASAELADLMSGEPPSTDADVARATELVEQAGGLDWATREADQRLAAALARLDGLDLVPSARADLAAVAHYIVARDR